MTNPSTSAVEAFKRLQAIEEAAIDVVKKHDEAWPPDQLDASIAALREALVDSTGNGLISN